MACLMMVCLDFNPRSLAGATDNTKIRFLCCGISIHAPSRERRFLIFYLIVIFLISIHAPSRERPIIDCKRLEAKEFQSTLPRGSDKILACLMMVCLDFNPRSLAGATDNTKIRFLCCGISIHAPSRERRFLIFYLIVIFLISIHAPSRERHLTDCISFCLIWHFNPRSLAGATGKP